MSRLNNRIVTYQGRSFLAIECPWAKFFGPTIELGRPAWHSKFKIQCGVVLKHGTDLVMVGSNGYSGYYLLLPKGKP